MTPESWQRLAALYAEEYEKNKTTLKEFCSAQGISYATAKKYISVRKVAGRAQMKPVDEKSRKKARTKRPQKSLDDGKDLLQERQKSPKKKQLKEGATKADLRGAKIADDFGVSDKEFNFARLVAQGMDKYKAFLEAGYTWNGANKPYAESSRIARKPRVMRAIFYFKELIQERYQFQMDEVVSQLMAIIRADPNDISQYRRINCRHCYGIEHKYQWRNMEEQQKATALAAQKKQPAPDISGGVGFVEARDPHPECPQCAGEGKGQMYMADTRDISGDARYLFQGVSMGKTGIEILQANKMEARKELLRLVEGTGGKAKEPESIIQLREELLREELRKKRAEAERLEFENLQRTQGGKPGEERTYVIELVNSPDDMEDDEDDAAQEAGSTDA